MRVPTIELRNLTKHFGQTRAVDGIDLRVNAGEIVAMLGPNGAGKTTAIDLILGLSAPTSGSVQLFGQTPRQAVIQRKIGAMMQTGGLLRDTTVRETLTMIAALQGVKDRVDEVLAQARLTELADRRVSKCSGGEQQRLKFALAILTQPQLLILDEPTAGMDVAARRDFWASMRDQAEAGRTIIFATHYLEEAQDFAQRIVLMGKGKILADGSTSKIRAMATGRVVSATLEGNPDQLAAALERYAGLPGVSNLELNGSRLSLTTGSSDELARTLLADGGHDLTIVEPSLEDVFVNLTKDAR